MIRTLIIPLLLCGWWIARSLTGLPVEGTEARSTIIAGTLGFGFLVVFGVYEWHIAKRELSQLLERLEILENTLDW